jgi:hypothetical protein
MTGQDGPEDAASIRRSLAFALGERVKFVVNAVGNIAAFRGSLSLVHTLIVEAQRTGNTECTPFFPRQASDLRRKLEAVSRTSAPELRERKLRALLRAAYEARGLEEELLNAIGPADDVPSQNQ